jgi:hypothetical protein
MPRWLKEVENYLWFHPNCDQKVCAFCINSKKLSETQVFCTYGWFEWGPRYLPVPFKSFCDSWKHYKGLKPFFEPQFEDFETFQQVYLIQAGAPAPTSVTSPKVDFLIKVKGGEIKFFDRLTFDETILKPNPIKPIDLMKNSAGGNVPNVLPFQVIPTHAYSVVQGSQKTEGVNKSVLRVLNLGMLMYDPMVRYQFLENQALNLMITRMFEGNGLSLLGDNSTLLKNPMDLTAAYENTHCYVSPSFYLTVFEKAQIFSIENSEEFYKKILRFENAAMVSRNLLYNHVQIQSEIQEEVTKVITSHPASSSPPDNDIIGSLPQCDSAEEYTEILETLTSVNPQLKEDFHQIIIKSGMLGATSDEDLSITNIEGLYFYKIYDFLHLCGVNGLFYVDANDNNRPRQAGDLDKFGLLKNPYIKVSPTTASAQLKKLDEIDFAKFESNVYHAYQSLIGSYCANNRIKNGNDQEKLKNHLESKFVALLKRVKEELQRHSNSGKIELISYRLSQIFTYLRSACNFSDFEVVGRFEEFLMKFRPRWFVDYTFVKLSHSLSILPSKKPKFFLTSQSKFGIDFDPVFDQLKYLFIKESCKDKRGNFTSQEIQFFQRMDTYFHEMFQLKVLKKELELEQNIITLFSSTSKDRFKVQFQSIRDALFEDELARWEKFAIVADNLKSMLKDYDGLEDTLTWHELIRQMRQRGETTRHDGSSPRQKTTKSKETNHPYRNILPVFRKHVAKSMLDTMTMDYGVDSKQKISLLLQDLEGYFLPMFWKEDQDISMGETLNTLISAFRKINRNYLPKFDAMNSDEIIYDFNRKGFKYLVNYIGGSLKFLQQFITSGINPYSSMNPVNKFRSLMEFNYLKDLYLGSSTRLGKKNVSHTINKILPMFVSEADCEAADALVHSLRTPKKTTSTKFSSKLQPKIEDILSRDIMMGLFQDQYKFKEIPRKIPSVQSLLKITEDPFKFTSRIQADSRMQEILLNYQHSRARLNYFFLKNHFKTTLTDEYYLKTNDRLIEESKSRKKLPKGAITLGGKQKIQINLPEFFETLSFKDDTEKQTTKYAFLHLAKRQIAYFITSMQKLVMSQKAFKKLSTKGLKKNEKVRAQNVNARLKKLNTFIRNAEITNDRIKENITNLTKIARCIDQFSFNDLARFSSAGQVVSNFQKSTKMNYRDLQKYFKIYRNILDRFSNPSTELFKEHFNRIGLRADPIYKVLLAKYGFDKEIIERENNKLFITLGYLSEKKLFYTLHSDFWDQPLDNSKISNNLYPSNLFASVKKLVKEIEDDSSLKNLIQASILERYPSIKIHDRENQDVVGDLLKALLLHQLYLIHQINENSKMDEEKIKSAIEKYKGRIRKFAVILNAHTFLCKNTTEAKQISKLLRIPSEKGFNFILKLRFLPSRAWGNTLANIIRRLINHPRVFRNDVYVYTDSAKTPIPKGKLYKTFKGVVEMLYNSLGAIALASNEGSITWDSNEIQDLYGEYVEGKQLEQMLDGGLSTSIFSNSPFDSISNTLREKIQCSREYFEDYYNQPSKKQKTLTGFFLNQATPFATVPTLNSLRYSSEVKFKLFTNFTENFEEDQDVPEVFAKMPQIDPNPHNFNRNEKIIQIEQIETKINNINEEINDLVAAKKNPFPYPINDKMTCTEAKHKNILAMQAQFSTIAQKSIAIKRLDSKKENLLYNKKKIEEEDVGEENQENAEDPIPSTPISKQDVNRIIQKIQTKSTPAFAQLEQYLIEGEFDLSIGLSKNLQKKQDHGAFIDSIFILPPKLPSNNLHCNLQLIIDDPLQSTQEKFAIFIEGVNKEGVGYKLGVDINRLNCFRTLTFSVLDENNNIIDIEYDLPEDHMRILLNDHSGRFWKQIQQTVLTDDFLRRPNKNNPFNVHSEKYTASFADEIMAPIKYWAMKRHQISLQNQFLQTRISSETNSKKEYRQRVQFKLNNNRLNGIRNAMKNYLKRVLAYVVKRTGVKFVVHENLSISAQGLQGTLGQIVQGMFKSIDQLSDLTKNTSPEVEFQGVSARNTSKFYQFDLNEDSTKIEVDRRGSSDWSLVYFIDDPVQTDFRIVDCHFSAANNIAAKLGKGLNNGNDPPPTAVGD